MMILLPNSEEEGKWQNEAADFSEAVPLYFPGGQ
jgi:hypothetical protein